MNYTAYDANHKHAVTNLSNGNTYGYNANGNMTSRYVLDGTVFKDYTLNYDAENRLVSVTGAATAAFDYDADGKQVKATVNGVTTYYVGNHYEVKNSVVTKYYFAGTTRLAARTGTTLSYLLSDHLGSSSVTTDANGAKTASALYKAFGETRYTSGTLSTDYKFTGQRLQAELGIYWFQSRWMDPLLGRFTQPDTIVPTSTQGTQAWDRYAFVNNNPVRYNDLTGHCIAFCDWIASQIQNTTLFGLMGLALGHVPQKPLSGSTLQAVLQDKDVVAKQNKMIAFIQSDPRYSNEAFNHEKLVEKVNLGDYGNFVASSVSGDPTFWGVHNSRLAATDIRSSQDGTLDITWKLKDNFDYLPAWDNHSRGGLTYWVYNSTATIFSFFFYDVMGASTELDVTTTWTTHTCPNGNVSTDPCPADPPTNDDRE